MLALLGRWLIREHQVDTHVGGFQALEPLAEHRHHLVETEDEFLRRRRCLVGQLVSET